MKKFLALLLAVMMIASMSITAFAATTDNLYYDTTTDASTSVNTSSSKVNVTSTGIDNGDNVYYVVVSWENLAFTYVFDNDAKWDPEKHEYVNPNADAAVGLWQVTGAKAGDTTNAKTAIIDKAITVANHSNASVWVATAFDAATNGTKLGVTAAVAQDVEADDNELVTAEGKEFADADKIRFDVSVTGTPQQNEDFELTTITVTVSTSNP